MSSPQSRPTPRPATLTPYPCKKSYKRNRTDIKSRVGSGIPIRVTHAVAVVADPNISSPINSSRSTRGHNKNKSSSNSINNSINNENRNSNNTPRHHLQNPPHRHPIQSPPSHPSQIDQTTIMSKNNRKTTPTSRTPTSSNRKKKNNYYGVGVGVGVGIDDELAKRMKRMKIELRRDDSVGTIMTAKGTILKNLRIWAGRVYDVVGHGQKEKVYQGVLRNVLLNQGFDVGMEVPFCFLRRDPRTGTVDKITRRADLIVSLPGQLDKVLIECKAKPKILKDDMEQVISYREHFGVDECYLVNFRPGLDVLRLREENVHVHPRGIPAAAPLGGQSSIQQQPKSVSGRSSIKQPSAPVQYNISSQVQSKQNPRSGVIGLKKNPTLAIDTTTPQSQSTLTSQRNPFPSAVTGLSSSSSRKIKTPSATGQMTRKNTSSPTGKSKNIKSSTTPMVTTPHVGGDDDRSSNRRNQNVHYRRQSLPTPTNNSNSTRVARPVVPSAPPEEDVLSHHNRRKQNVLPMDRLRLLNTWKTTNLP